MGTLLATMGFGKPASYLAAIIFAVGAVSGIITLIVSAVFGYATGGGYGLGVTSGLLGFLVCSVMILWMVFTNLNEFDPAWIIFLVAICISPSAEALSAPAVVRIHLMSKE